MKLRLTGHDYKYAVEQIMLSLFPDERPEYGGGEQSGMSAEISLRYGKVYVQAVSSINAGGQIYNGTARAAIKKLTGKHETDRLLQRLLKQSFYKAALPLIKKPPVWGSLTGIRPAKLLLAMLESGISENAAVKKLSHEYYVSPERIELCMDAAKASLSVKRTLEPRDFALYIGIPFCPTRCAYCSFVSNSTEKSFGLIEPFLSALYKEMEIVAEAAEKLGLRAVAVYIGGGTPTVLSAEQLYELTARIKKSFDLSRVREYTVEAGRPDTITGEKLEAVKSGGAARVSVNPQSMSSEVLEAIGRKHTPEAVIDAAELVRKCGGLELNMDLIAGLPEDTPEGFCRSLDIVLGLRPENITVHTLSLKKGSRITLEGTRLPGPEQVAHMLDYAGDRLRAEGYSPYYLYRQKFTSGGFENTGWCLPGREGIYNICMMEELCTVAALGGGGVTKLVSPGGRLERVFNVKYPLEYIGRPSMPADKIGRIADFYKAEERNGI